MILVPFQRSNTVRNLFLKLLKMQQGKQRYRSGFIPTFCDTVMQHIIWNRGLTSGSYKNGWVMKALKRQKGIHTFRKIYLLLKIPLMISFRKKVGLFRILGRITQTDISNINVTGWVIPTLQLIVKTASYKICIFEKR